MGDFAHSCDLLVSIPSEAVDFPCCLILICIAGRSALLVGDCTFCVKGSALLEFRWGLLLDSAHFCQTWLSGLFDLSSVAVRSASAFHCCRRYFVAMFPLAVLSGGGWLLSFGLF